MEHKIVIVDGDDRYRAFLVDFFGTRDFHVVGCGTYAEAETVLSQTRFDIAIIDYFVGAECGKVFCDSFRSRFSQQTSLIIMSEAQSPGIELSIRAHAPDFYFVKPFVVDNLYAVVLRIVQARDRKALMQRNALAV